MKKIIITSLGLALTISTVSAGWHESFDTDAYPNGFGPFTSDITWTWWGWGQCTVDSGSVKLKGGEDIFGLNSSWIQNDQEITPDSATMYLKVKFTTTGTPSNFDQLHVCVAIDPSWVLNRNVYTVASSPTGLIGEFYFVTEFADGAQHPDVSYDSWFWEKIVVDGQSISIYPFADGDTPADTAFWTFTTNNVAIGAGLASLYIVALTDDDSSTVHIDEIWYNETPTGLGISDDTPIISGYELGPNYPNPFNPITHFRFNIPETGDAKLTVFNTLGKPVAILVDGTISEGGHTVSWNAENIPTGVYFYRLESNYFTQTRKLLLIK
jgi:hypothetical protein